jgi:DNA-binding transcriptional regulator YdaS (Cro superfamily)
MQSLTEQEVIEQLRSAIASAGGQRAYADVHGFTPGYVSDVMRGKRALADRILATIGVERIVTYTKRQPEEEA